MSTSEEPELTEAAQDMLARWYVRSAMGFLAAFAAVGVYGARTAFFASPHWAGLAPWISLGVGALTTVWCFRVIFRGRLRPQAYERAVWSGALLVYAPPAVCVLLSWCVLARALPDIYTRLVGAPVEVITVLDKKRVWIGRYSGFTRLTGGCNEHVLGAPFETGSFRNYYCANRREWQAVQNFTPVKIVERRSWFGVHIDHIESVATEYHPL